MLQNVPDRNGVRPLARIAQQTEGFSGSDLMELCSRAAVASLQDQMSRQAVPSYNVSWSSLFLNDAMNVTHACMAGSCVPVS